MIHLTRLNDSDFVIDPDLVERIYANPGTTLVTVDGTAFIAVSALTSKRCCCPPILLVLGSTIFITVTGGAPCRTPGAPSSVWARP